MLSADPEALFARHSIELLAHALNESRDTLPIPSEPARAALFPRARRLISLKVGDATLTPDRIAAELHVSTRALDRIFAERNEVVVRRVYDERSGRPQSTSRARVTDRSRKSPLPAGSTSARTSVASSLDACRSMRLDGGSSRVTGRLRRDDPIRDLRVDPFRAEMLPRQSSRTIAYWKERRQRSGDSIS